MLANGFTTFTNDKILSTPVVTNNVFMSGTVYERGRISP